MIQNLTALEMLLRIYFDPAGHPDECSAVACNRDAIQFLLSKDLIVPAITPRTYGGRYKATERAAFYIEHLRMIPLPEKIWEWQIPGAK